MKTIKKLHYMVALSLASLIGCREAPYVEKNVSQYNGYDVMVQDNEIRIGTLHNDEHSSSGFDETIYAVVGEDSTVSNIQIYTNKGSKLEELASVPKIRQIYFDVKGKQKLLKQVGTK